MKWYYKKYRTKIEHGPVLFDDLSLMVFSGELKPKDTVRPQRGKAWQKASECEQLKSSFEQSSEWAARNNPISSIDFDSPIAKAQHCHSPIIGIDFGTTKTMVAEYDPAKRFAKVRKLGRGGDEMPTSIYVTNGNEVLFGDDADDEGIHDYLNHIRRFKMLLGKGTETQFGNKTSKPVELAAAFLSHLRARLESEVCHRAVDQVVLTVPAMFGPAQRKDLMTAAKSAGFKNVELLHEPVAAGIAYCDHHTDLSKNIRFLVVDWGGGTFDLAVVERNEAGECRVLSEYVAGAGDIGGEDLDEELWIAVSDMLKSSGKQPLESQPVHELGKYRRELTRAKESLSLKSQVTASFTLAGGKLERIPLERSKLEEIIHEKISIGVDQVAELLRRCKNSGCKLDFVLLAGGTSQIPMIKQVFEETLQIDCRVWSEGRDAIALGAAIRANELFEINRHSRESNSALASSHTDKILAMSQYKSLLEGAWIDRVITNDERVLLRKKREELGLTIEESQAIQIQVLGAPIIDVAKPTKPKISEIYPRQENLAIAAKNRSNTLKQKVLKIIRSEFSKSPNEYVYIHPEIPEKMARNALKSYAKLKSIDLVLLLQDNSFWKSGKAGIIMTDSAIIWSTNSNPIRIAYKDIKTIVLKKRFMAPNEICINGKIIMYPYSYSNNTEFAQTMARILSSLSRLNGRVSS